MAGGGSSASGRGVVVWMYRHECACGFGGGAGGAEACGRGVAGPVLPVVPWVLSGRSAEAVRGQAGRLLGFVGGCPVLIWWMWGFRW